MTEPQPAMRLRAAVSTAEALLASLDDTATQKRPAPGKWSPREILGHLIDSASNNHQRFVRAGSQDDLIFRGYEQDYWVEVQDYQRAPWRELMLLWASFNRHLARVMEAIPEDVRLRSHRRHNLHEVAWRAVPETEPATLQYFMNDYVDHLEHHLSQILGDSWKAGPRR